MVEVGKSWQKQEVPGGWETNINTKGVNTVGNLQRTDNLKKSNIIRNKNFV